MPDTICDTSPLQHLHRAGVLDVLSSLYERIVIPESVAEELNEGREAGLELPDISQLEWIEVRAIKNPDMVSISTGLGPAEREALGMAMEIPGSRLIMDDTLGRRHARLLRQPVTGTIGVLLKAKRKQLVRKVEPVLDRLDARGFKLTADSRATILAWTGEA